MYGNTLSATLIGFGKLKESIQSVVSLTHDEWVMMTDVIEIRSLKKNELFLREQEICNSIGFVNKGSLIYYKILENADEVTTDFAFECEWVTNNHSRLNCSPSHLNIRAMEDAELLVVKQCDLAGLYDKIPKLERFGRILTEQAYVKLVQLSVDLQTLPAKDRYLKLLKAYPEIFQKIPLYHIANYLGIAPKSLSRIRRTIFTEK